MNSAQKKLVLAFVAVTATFLIHECAQAAGSKSVFKSEIINGRYLLNMESNIENCPPEISIHWDEKSTVFQASPLFSAFNVDVGVYERTTLSDGQTVDTRIREIKIGPKKSDREAHLRSLEYINWMRYLEEGGFKYKSDARTSRNSLRYSYNKRRIDSDGMITRGETLQNLEIEIVLANEKEALKNGDAKILQISIDRSDSENHINERLTCRYTESDSVSSDLSDILGN